MRTIVSARRWIAILPVALVAVLALQCIETPLSPIAPTWQTQLSIPLADITRTLDEAFKDTTARRDADGVFYFEATQSGQPVNLDTLKVSPEPSAEQVSVGLVEVSAIPTTTTGIIASDIPGLPSSVPAGFPFPATPINLPVLAVGDTSQFAFAAVDSGSLTLSVTNNMPMAITFNAPVVLKNNLPGLDTTNIASFTFGTLAPGETAMRSSSLANKLARGLIKTDPVNVTLAAMTGPFSFVGAGVQLSFGSTNLRVDSARALVPPQQVVTINDTVIVIDDTVSVTDARFTRGSFGTRIVNDLDVRVGVRIRIDNFVGVSSGQPLTILRTILPKSVFDTTFNLRDLRLSNPTPDTMGTRVKFSVGIETITSAGQKTTIASSDFVRAEFNPASDFVLQSITGRIKPTILPVNFGSSGIALGDAADKFAGQFTFKSVRIAVNLGMTGGYPVRYSLALEARNRRYGKIATLRLPPPVGATNPLDTTFYPTSGTMAMIPLGSTDELNSFLSNFFPNFPDTFIVRGNVTVNPGFTEATIQDTAKFYQRLDMYFPLNMGLAGGRIEDKIALGQETNFPTEFANDIKSASLRFSVGNRIPAQLGFRLHLIGRLTPTSPVDTLLRIPTDGSVRTIAAAPVDANGNSLSEVASHFDIGLTSSDVALFNKADTMYFRLDLQTSGGGTQAVRFRTTDYVRLRMSGNLIYLVNNPN